MRILAIETSTDLASCALYCDGQMTEQVCPRTPGQDGQHSATLLTAMGRLLSKQQINVSDLDAVAFGSGPGAFTGLRMACAIAQGLAVPFDVPVIPVCGLTAMSWQTRQDLDLLPVPSRMTVLLDARMGELYCGNYVFDEFEAHLLGDIRLCTPDQLLGQKDELQFVCGNCFTENPQLLAYFEGQGSKVFADLVPSARAIAEIAALELQRGGAIDAALAAPLYVRDKVAKTVAERLSEGGRA